jgi:hypothetical protein
MSKLPPGRSGSSPTSDWACALRHCRASYGKRLSELRPTERSAPYLWGDDLGAFDRVARLNGSLRSN